MSHFLFHEIVLIVIRNEVAVFANACSSSPVIQYDGFPLFGFGRFIARIQNGIDYISVIESFAGCGAFFDAIKHLGEHMIVTQFIELIAHREKPASIRFCFFRDIISALPGREHFKTSTEKTIDPNGSFCSHHFIPEIQSAAEGPAHFKLCNGTILIFYQRDRVVFCINGFHLCIGPTHRFNRLDVFTDIAPRDLYAVAAKIK